MAVGDFSPSASQNIQLEMSELFSGGPTGNIFNTPIDTAKVIFENQSMVELPTIVDGKCVETKVYWLTDKTADISYDGSEPDPDLGCDLPDGHQGEGEAKTYNPDIFLREDRMIDDNLCGNDYDFASLSAFELARAMALLRKKLNEKSIVHLNANVQAPIVGSTGYTINGNAIEVPSSSFNPDLMASIYRTATINQIMNFKIHNGSNFFERFFNAQHNNLDNDKKNELSKLGALDNMSYDLRALDQQLNEQSTFVFDPQMIGFFNYRGNHGYTAQMTDTSKNIWEFLIDDPVLSYQRIVRSPNGGMTVQTVPVTYRVEYQKICNTRNAYGERTNMHKYNLHFVGGLTTAPQGANGETNILKFKKV